MAPEARWSVPVRLGVALLLSVTGLVWIAHALVNLTFPYQLDYGEGAVLEYTAVVQRGLPLYRPADEPPFLVCTYTPLYIGLAAL
ncbi:MAG: hypothetical protein AB1758_14175, partial [Candidatus Eremiobacterota bacterium]